jgi:hypothetical protein
MKVRDFDYTYWGETLVVPVDAAAQRHTHLTTLGLVVNHKLCVDDVDDPAITGRGSHGCAKDTHFGGADRSRGQGSK